MAIPKKKKKKKKKELPAWYYRVCALADKEGRDISPEDFDEDISDLDQTTKEREKVTVSATPDREYDGENFEEDQNQDEDDDDDDDDNDEEEDGEDEEDASDSNDESDADDYYDLKAEREERKRELRDMREAKEETLNFERNQEIKVRDVYKSLKKAEKKSKIPLNSLDGKTFSLYSTVYLDYCYRLDPETSKHVSFYSRHRDCSPFEHLLPAKQEGKVRGHVEFNTDSDCSFGLFDPPKYAGLKKVWLWGGDRKKKGPMFRFLSNDYLKLKVSSKLVFSEGDPPPDAPEFIEFVGIDREKERAERERQMKKKRARSPSPKENWFEMNHSMGWWNQGY